LLIADDEPLIRAGIRHDLADEPDVEIVAECETVAETIAAIHRGQIDLAMLDIQLPDGSGFDVIREVGPAAMPAVVFVTAFDKYAIQAFECSAADYILKPFDDLRLKAGLARARVRLAQPSSVVQQLEALLSNRSSRWLQRLVVRNGERIELVPVELIDWIESANNYAVLHCGPKTHIVGETLTGLEQRLSPEVFLRIHRGRIVNLSRIAALYPAHGGVYEVELTSGVRLSSGRQYREGIQRLINNASVL
jgi:two-component system LytT family response regulator